MGDRKNIFIVLFFVLLIFPLYANGAKETLSDEAKVCLTCHSNKGMYQVLENKETLSLYIDKDLVREQPFIASLYEIFMKARPRPVSPYYMMMTQVMQPEFSAALSGIKTPEEALRSAQKQIEHILTTEQ